MISEDFFQRITTQFNTQLPFVIYRKPNDEKISGRLQNNDNLYFTENFTEKGFVFSPFDEFEKTILIPVENSQSISTQNTFFKEKLNQNKTFKKTAIFSEEEQQNHINLIKKGVKAISSNSLEKVVLSRQERIAVGDENPIRLFKNLLSTYTSAFVYCWYHPKIGIWLGATPETLIEIEGNKFSIMALAGTQNYKNTLDVVWQDKEKKEQQFVTDYVIENLNPLVENYQVSATETVKAGNLLHLKTMISAQLKPKMPLKQLLSVLHPTPAVCGVPKKESKQFILKNENYKREFYTGFLGELNFEKTISPRSGRRNIENRAYSITKKNTQLYVNLRCMQLKDKQAIIYVGGGVTLNSNPEKEWEETVSKSLIIKSIL